MLHLAESFVAKWTIVLSITNSQFYSIVFSSRFRSGPGPEFSVPIPNPYRLSILGLTPPLPMPVFDFLQNKNYALPDIFNKLFENKNAPEASTIADEIYIAICNIFNLNLKRRLVEIK